MRNFRKFAAPTLAGPLMLGLTIQWIDLGPIPLSQISYLVPFFALIPFLMKSCAVKPPSMIVGYWIFVAALIVAVPFSNDLGEGFSVIARSIVYSVLAYFMYFWLSTEDQNRREEQLANAIFWVVPGFCVAYYVSSLVAGVNVFRILTIGITTGNPYIIQYQMFDLVFNRGNVDGEFSSAARHGIIISLFTASYLHIFLRKRRSVLGNVYCTGIVIFALLSFSRSSLLGAALGLACYIMFRIAQRTFPWGKLLMALGGVSVMLLTANLVGTNLGIADILQEKLVADIADNPRVHEFYQIVEKIDDRAFLGWGTGTSLNLVGLSAQYPHNFILYAWHQAGILGLFTGVAFVALTLLLIANYVSNAMHFSRSDEVVARRFILGAILMCFVLVRLMFAKAGLLAVPEWTALALSCYAVMNARRLRSARHRSPYEIPHGIGYQPGVTA